MNIMKLSSEVRREIRDREMRKAEEEIERQTQIRKSAVNAKQNAIRQTSKANEEAAKAKYESKVQDLEYKKKKSLKGGGCLGAILMFFFGAGLLVVLLNVITGHMSALKNLLIYVPFFLLGLYFVMRSKKASKNEMEYDRLISDEKESFEKQKQRIDEERTISESEAAKAIVNDDVEKQLRQNAIQTGNKIVSEYDKSVEDFRAMILRSKTLDLGFIEEPMTQILRARYEALKVNCPGEINYEVSINYDVRLDGVYYEIHDGFENNMNMTENNKQADMIFFSQNRMADLTENFQREGLALAIIDKMDKCIHREFERDKFETEYQQGDSKVSIILRLICLDNKKELQGWDEGKTQMTWEDVSQNDGSSDDGSVQYW